MNFECDISNTYTIGNYLTETTMHTNAPYANNRENYNLSHSEHNTGHNNNLNNESGTFDSLLSGVDESDSTSDDGIFYKTFLYFEITKLVFIITRDE